MKKGIFWLAVLGCMAALAYLGLQPKAEQKQTKKTADYTMVYTGQEQNGKLSGQGTITFANGDRYTGEFTNGLFDGQGTYLAKDGWQYTGQFAAGKADGQGSLTTKGGLVYTGSFKAGSFQAK